MDTPSGTVPDSHPAAPHSIEPTVPNLSDLTLTSDPSPPATHLRDRPQRRKRGRFACIRCRRLKVKCDEKRPCSTCSRRDRECLYNERTEPFRKDPREQRIEDLQTQVETLEQFLTTLCSTRPEDLQDLLDQVQNDTRSRTSASASASLPADTSDDAHQDTRRGDEGVVRTFAILGNAVAYDENLLPTSTRATDHGGSSASLYRISIAQQIIETVRSGEPQEILSLINQLRSKSLLLNQAHIHSRQMGHNSGLYDDTSFRKYSEPKFLVPCKPWIGVVEDDVAVSHALSAFFTWHQPSVSTVVVQRAFLRGMRSGDTQAAFCSPILVNAVLALGYLYCHRLDLPWDRKYEKHMSTLFISEAARLWLQDETPRLTTVQALLQMGCWYDLRGQDRMGTKLTRAAMKMATELKLHSQTSCPIDEDLGVERSVLHNDFAEAVWGIFNWHTLYSHVSGTPVVWHQPPRIPLPSPDNYRHDMDVWTPYPQTWPQMYSMEYSFMQAVSLFSIILNDATGFLHGITDRTDRAPLLSQAIRLIERLEAWKANSPACLDIPDCLTPHNILFHMTYYYAMCSVCQPFRPRFIEQSRFDFDATIMFCLEKSRYLLDLYHKTHRWESGCSVLLWHLHIGAASASERLGPVGPGELTEEQQLWRDDFERCVSGLWHLLPSWDLARPLLRILQMSLRHMGITDTDLPDYTRQIFDWFHHQIWAPDDRNVERKFDSDARWVYPRGLLESDVLRADDGQTLLGMSDALQALDSLYRSTPDQ